VVLEYLASVPSASVARQAEPRSARKAAKEDDDEVVIVGERFNAAAEADPAPKRRKALKMRQTQITCAYDDTHAVHGLV
jgi:hypothetical protein